MEDSAQAGVQALPFAVREHCKQQDCREVCRLAFESWRGLKDGDLEVTEVSGGVTNVLLKVEAPQSSGLSPVVVRVFGNNTEKFIDRGTEAKCIKALAPLGFGAQVLAEFSNGRIEAFLDCHTLEPEELAHPVLSARIACKLHEFHSTEVDIPRVPQLFPLVRKFISVANSISFTKAEDQKRFEGLHLDRIAAELDELEQMCVDSRSPVVFTHNDLLAGNILLLRDPGSGGFDNEKGTMTFIDFEYGCYSFRGFDFGNHFNEYAGFECDWSRYPNHDQQRRFVAAYLQHGTEVPPTDEEVERLVAEADLFSLASHIFWGVWAILQAGFSPIDFDYLEYSQNRLGEYYRRRGDVMRMAREFLLMGN
ncbi:unnamed protein product [Ostreobium quekettii]|uniref:ethanolamine kinase n=1 Tax=Ostreobium quekettii TaxID=121088 RepID=A0A8S1IX62_9CHLO|nr:unnamed protein product [Ostreobium quekettii]|eukprot:evm.model.scf_2038.1 EVM.evm.TU.scf_2038.1   scf_2038:6525-9967(+)